MLYTGEHVFGPIGNADIDGEITMALEEMRPFAS